MPNPTPQLKPRPETFLAIRKALRVYQVASVITGVGLLLLVAEMILKYSPLHVEVFLGGSGGLAWTAPALPGPACEWFSLLLPNSACSIESTGDGFNLSTGILVAHGWFYVVYLALSFRLWSLMRWPFRTFVVLALAGVVPFLSFIAESWATSRVRRQLTPQ
ncbi:DUF3817 domain-containing protein [Leucobacter rhizosphaerae]|uniref:DUF3817 domain-containing protein n=1 Tax=Leucobacter rhizosphaerae TaxID=2932245 RepID=A0ABY4G034_9MICO|nr:DUF3817 domain-containing protein [Leucobacter rhizosphaerae]UOQ61910.1 DUF3817 domain-containing protein [Leucobacter rhizosphaerae]